MWIISQALMKDYENSLSLQVRAVESLAENFSDGAQSVPLSTNPMPQVYLSQDRTTEAYRRFQSLMTSETLTEDRGEELLTWYLEDSLAPTFQLQEKEKVSQERTLDSGKKWHVCFGRYDQDLRLLKTAQLCLIEDSMSYLSTFPNQGLMLRGELLAQKPLEQDISAIGFGVSPDGETFFHTPNTAGLDGGSNSRKALKKRQMRQTPIANLAQHSGQVKYKPGQQLQLTQQVNNPHLWPTPTSSNGGSNSQSDAVNERGHGINLVGAVQKWPTPQTRGFTNDGDLMQLAKVCDNYEEMSAMAYRAAHKKKSGFWPPPKASEPGMSAKCSDRHYSKSTHLTMQVAIAEEMIDEDTGNLKKWPTPQYRDFRSGQAKRFEERQQKNLNDAVAKFPTPVASMYKGSSEASLTRNNGRDRTNDRLDHFVGDTATARLNPDWVELLMLWPKYWTSLEQSPDMDKWGSTDDDWEEGTPRVTSSCANRAARLKAIGNGQVPLVAARAWQLLIKRFE